MTKASRLALLSRVKRALAALGYTPGSSVSKSDANDLYEAFLLTRVLEAAIAEGFTVHLDYDVPPTATSSPPASLCVRRSPARLHTAKDTAGRPYTHPVLTSTKGRILGVYAGVQVKGMSGVLSEADVLVMDESVATTRVRATPPEDPTADDGDVLIHLEAKNYSTAAGLAVTRSFVGMAADFYDTRRDPSKDATSLLVATVVGTSAAQFVDRTPSVATKVLSGVFPEADAQLFVHLRKLLKSTSAREVHPGAYCEPPGMQGVTKTGTPMTCSLDSAGKRNRWKR